MSHPKHQRHLSPGNPQNATRSVALACIFGFLLLRGWGREKTRAWRKWQQTLVDALDAGLEVFTVISYHTWLTILLSAALFYTTVAVFKTLSLLFYLLTLVLQ